MSTEAFESAKRLMKFAPFHHVDSYSEKKLSGTIDSYLMDVGKEDIASVKFKINGKEYPFIYDAIDEVKDIKEIEIKFFDGNYETSWIFNTPTSVAKIYPEGVGFLHLTPPLPEGTDGEPQEKREKAMFRTFIVKHYRPQSLKAELSNKSEELDIMPFGLIRMEQLWHNIREEGVIPIQIRVCAYTQQTRYIYILDLVRNKLLFDSRENKIPRVNLLKRDGLHFFHLDRIITMKEIPELSKKIMEITFESKELDLQDLAYIFNVTDKTIIPYMTVLLRRGFVTAVGRPPNEKYIANIDGMSKIS